MSGDLESDGFRCFAYDQGIADWAKAAIGPALGIAADAAQQARWLRGEGTWFVGVDALRNGADGAVAGQALQGAVLDHVAALGWMPAEWHRAQVSVVYPGYPGPMRGESPAAARFRRDRDAAHVDGLHKTPSGGRSLVEPHQFILGLPLNHAPQGASPLVVWRGAHQIMRRAFATALDGIAPALWHQVDLAETYQQARRACFETCERVELPVQPGEATLVHRHMLHGVAPWQAGPCAQGRVIAYFRPECQRRSDWL